MVTGDASSLNTVGNYDGGHIILDSPDYTFFPIGPSIGIDHENIKDKIIPNKCSFKISMFPTSYNCID